MRVEKRSTKSSKKEVFYLEYVFGTDDGRETLRTKGDTHTDLTGFCQIERVYPDQTITDNFRIIKKTSSKKDVEGNCYDWYEIDRHYRTVDRTPALKAENEALRQKVAALTDQQSFYEDCIAEMAEVVYA